MATYSGTLNPGQQLNVNDTLTAPTNPYQLILQEDGNLVLYRLADNYPTWASNTVGQSSQFAIMQDDGNFVIYDTSGKALWASGGPGGYGGAILSLQDDGNLIVHTQDVVLWASNTNMPCLFAGQQLLVNDTLHSPSNSCFLILQADGNLVLYQTNNSQALWASGTDGKASSSAIMQGDGNFVIYDVSGNALWASNTPTGYGGSFLTVMDQGYITIISPNDANVWASSSGSSSGGGDSVAVVLQAVEAVNVVTTQSVATETSVGVIAEVVIVLT